MTSLRVAGSIAVDDTIAPVTAPPRTTVISWSSSPTHSSREVRSLGLGVRADHADRLEPELRMVGHDLTDLGRLVVDANDHARAG